MDFTVRGSILCNGFREWLAHTDLAHSNPLLDNADTDALHGRESQISHNNK